MNSVDPLDWLFQTLIRIAQDGPQPNSKRLWS
jgi:hypothetical protein